MLQHQNEYNQKFHTTERLFLTGVMEIMAEFNLPDGLPKRLAGLATATVRDYRDVASSMWIDVANSEPIDWTKAPTPEESEEDKERKHTIDYAQLKRALKESNLIKPVQDFALEIFDVFEANNCISTSDRLFKEIASVHGKHNEIQTYITALINAGFINKCISVDNKKARAFYFPKD